MSYKVEIIEIKYPIVQSEASKSIIKDLFSDLLNETKKFEVSDYCRSFVKKYNLNGEIKFAPACSSWNVESVKSQYINISTHRPLSGSSYISLPLKLKSPRKD